MCEMQTLLISLELSLLLLLLAFRGISSKPLLLKTTLMRSIPYRTEGTNEKIFHSWIIWNCPVV